MKIIRKTISSGYQILPEMDTSILGTKTYQIRYTEHGVTRTANLTIEVSIMTKVCPVCGTEYELDQDNVDPGCPVCSEVVVSIEAIPEEVTVNLGDPLPIQVKASYRDGKVRMVTGWTSNYDSVKSVCSK